MTVTRPAAPRPPESPAGRPFYLLAALLLTFVCVPAASSFAGDTQPVWLDLTMRVAMLVVLVVAATTVAQSRSPVLATVVLIGPPAALELLQAIAGDAGTSIRSIGALYVGLALLYAVVRGMQHLFRKRRVTADTLATALCAYLLIGLAWTLLYVAVEIADPSAAAFGEGEKGSGDLFYFSFVTLSTLGYGDLTPTTSTARSLAIVEAIIGQFYVAVVLARLVAMQLTAHREQHAGDADDQG